MATTMNPEKARQQKRDWREKNRETVTECNRKYREANRAILRARARKYREENLDKVRAANRKWFEENPDKAKQCYRNYYRANQEAATEYQRNRRAANPQLAHARDRNYYEKNAAVISKRARKWRDEHPEESRAKDARGRHARRARERGVESERLNPLAVFVSDDYICQRCGLNVHQYKGPGWYRDRATIDHIIALANTNRGGDNTSNNRQTMCSMCNSEKGHGDDDPTRRPSAARAVRDKAARDRGELSRDIQMSDEAQAKRIPWPVSDLMLEALGAISLAALAATGLTSSDKNKKGAA